MRILYFDCFYGINEEAALRSLMGLGIEEAYIEEELSKGKFFSFEEDNTIDLQQALHIVNNSGLKEYVKIKSSEVINIIYDAVNKFERLNFRRKHSILSMGNLRTVVSIAICLEHLKPEKILSSRLEIGRGTKVLENSVLQIPEPLTFEILKGVPIKNDFVNIEGTTLIGAAIIASITEEFTEERKFIIRSSGYGTVNGGVFSVYLAEGRDYDNKDSANIDSETGCIYDSQFILECNIDDMNPEIYDVVMKKLLKAGAADVYFTPIIMKKGRPAIKVSVLCSKNQVKSMENVLFRETSTFGIRRYEVSKTMLQRSFGKVKTKYGEITVKRGFYKGEAIKAKPEHDECRAVAEELGISVIEVYKEVWKYI